MTKSVSHGLVGHPDRIVIEHALDNNVPLRAIADQHGISKSTLARWKSMREQGVLRPEEPVIPQGTRPAAPAPVLSQPQSPANPGLAQPVAQPAFDDAPTDQIERLRKVLTMSAMRLGQQHMAREFGVNTRTIRNWLTEARRRKLQVLSQFDAVHHLSDALFALDVAKSEALKLIYRAKAAGDEPALAAGLSQLRAIVREQVEMTDRLGGFEGAAVTIKHEKSAAEDDANSLQELARRLLSPDFNPSVPLTFAPPTPDPDDEPEEGLL